MRQSLSGGIRESRMPETKEETMKTTMATRRTATVEHTERWCCAPIMPQQGHDICAVAVEGNPAFDPL